MISFNTHSTANLPALPILKNPSFFSSKTQTLHVLRNFTILVDTTATLLQFGEKNFHGQNRHFRHFRTLTFGGPYHTASKRLKTSDLGVLTEWIIFLPYYKHGRKIMMQHVGLCLKNSFSLVFLLVSECRKFHRGILV